MVFIKPGSSLLALYKKNTQVEYHDAIYQEPHILISSYSEMLKLYCRTHHDVKPIPVYPILFLSRSITLNPLFERQLTIEESCFKSCKALTWAYHHENAASRISPEVNVIPKLYCLPKISRIIDDVHMEGFDMRFI